MLACPLHHKCFPWQDLGQRNQGNIQASGKLLAETMNHHILVHCSRSTIITLLLQHSSPVLKLGVLRAVIFFNIVA